MDVFEDTNEDIFLTPRQTPLLKSTQQAEPSTLDSSDLDLDLQHPHNGQNTQSTTPRLDHGDQCTDQETVTAKEAPHTPVRASAKTMHGRLGHLIDLGSSPFPISPPSTPRSEVGSDGFDHSDTASTWSDESIASAPPSSPSYRFPNLAYASSPTKAKSRISLSSNQTEPDTSLLQRRSLQFASTRTFDHWVQSQGFLATRFDAPHGITEEVQAGTKSGLGRKKPELTPLQLSREKRKIMIRKISYHNTDVFQVLIRRSSTYNAEAVERELDRGYGSRIYEKRSHNAALLDKQLAKMTLYFTTPRSAESGS